MLNIVKYKTFHSMHYAYPLPRETRLYSKELSKYVQWLPGFFSVYGLYDMEILNCDSAVHQRTFRISEYYSIQSPQTPNKSFVLQSADAVRWFFYSTRCFGYHCLGHWLCLWYDGYTCLYFVFCNRNTPKNNELLHQEHYSVNHTGKH